MGMLILELRLMLLSSHIGFNLVSAVFALMASISGLEPSSVIIDHRYLKLASVR